MCDPGPWTVTGFLPVFLNILCARVYTFISSIMGCILCSLFGKVTRSCYCDYKMWSQKWYCDNTSRFRNVNLNYQNINPLSILWREVTEGVWNYSEFFYVRQFAHKSAFYLQDYEAWRGLGESKLHRYSNGKQKVENLNESVEEDTHQKKVGIAPFIRNRNLHLFEQKLCDGRLEEIVKFVTDW